MCGAVRYTYDGDFGDITVCHCSDCRKAQGGAGVVAAPVETTQLHWVQGKDAITEYESSPGKKRAFCGRCGAPLYSRRDDAPQILRLRMGSIDSRIQAVPMAHIFVHDLPLWAALDDALPRYPGNEPERQ